jgi:vacuolar-type H+-ATPase subunit E/Vma4
LLLIDLFQETLKEAKSIGNEQREKYREIVATHREAAEKRRQTGEKRLKKN